MGYFAECYLNSGVTVGYGYVFDVVMVRFFQVMVCSHVTCFQVKSPLFLSLKGKGFDRI
ncbi:hypothetical protein F383_34134 [Gossypium arboreum]|uniref:Uncharacterized protein n=1 Tax=Gossypium arboreum TaxID=29729 RepID=A0A0B0MZF1_GOSAR|nr:hypothetical protein F383_34134 [Gossypium arboreum]